MQTWQTSKQANKQKDKMGKTNKAWSTQTKCCNKTNKWKKTIKHKHKTSKQTSKQVNKQTNKNVNLQTCQTKSKLMSKKSKRKSNKKNTEPWTWNKCKQTKTSNRALTELTTIPVISQPIFTALLVNQSDCVIFVFKVYE